jgi:hypothetical protein
VIESKLKEVSVLQLFVSKLQGTSAEFTRDKFADIRNESNRTTVPLIVTSITDGTTYFVLNAAAATDLGDLGVHASLHCLYTSLIEARRAANRDYENRTRMCKVQSHNVI